MNIRSLALITLLLSCGTALADQNIQPVKVRAHAARSMEVACASQSAPRAADVERVLAVNDRTQTRQLGRQLASAVGEACNAGEDTILVQRSATGQSLTWRPARDIDASVAAN